MLPIRVPLGEGEFPASFCSRLALVNGCRSARNFCEDTGLGFRDIVNGSPDALAVLAELGGVQFETLFASAIHKADDRYRIGTEILSKEAIRWRGLLVCPACIDEDAARWGYVEEAASCYRTIWLIAGVTTCVRHNLKLIELDSAKGASGLARHDTAPRIEEELLFIGGKIEPRRASPLEVYVSDRLNGLRGESWFDQLPLYAVIKASEMVGASAYRGHRVSIQDLDDDARFHSASIGFQILSAGPDSFRTFLMSFRAQRGHVTGDPGMRAMFGQLYQWLAHNTQDAAYHPLRDIMRDVALDSLAFEDGARVFGQPVEPRRVHSIYTASQLTGTSRPTLRSFLREGGFISDEDLRKTDDAVIIPITAELTQFLAEIRTAMTFAEATEYLGITRRQMEHLLDAGFIVPINTTMVSHNRYSFSRRELNRFLTVLLQDIPEIGPWEEGLVDITTAALKATCRSIDVVMLVILRQLPTIRFSREANGYNSIRVSAEEVKAAKKAVGR